MGTVLQDNDSLREAEVSLERENNVLKYVLYTELALGFAVTVYGLYRYLNTGQYGWSLGGAFVIFLGLAHFIKRNTNESNLNYVKAGRSGENFVRKILSQELPEDHFILNDVDVSSGRRNAQIDHIVLSDSGIFVVETKTYGGRLTGSVDNEQWSREETKQGSSSLKNPIKQNHYHCEVLTAFLEESGIKIDSRNIYSVVAMVNKQCEWSIQGDDQEVTYAWNVPEKISYLGRSNSISTEQKRAILESLNVNLPDRLVQ